MPILGVLFTLSVLALNLWGMMLGAGWVWRNRWMALSLGPLVLVSLTYGIECHFGLGPSLGVLALAGTVLSAALVALSAGLEPRWRLGPAARARLDAWQAEFAPLRALTCLAVAGGVFLYALTWRWCFPDVDGSSEKIADFSYICSYYHGDTIPVADDWLYPFLSVQYYSFQHYGAALMGRLLGLPTGMDYNLSLSLLIALGGSAFSGTVWMIAKRWWVRALVIAAFLVGGMGPTLLVHLTNEHVNPWTGMRYIGSAPLDRAPIGTWLKAYEGQYESQDLPGEPFSYSIYLGDFHPPLSGYYILGVTGMAMVLWFQQRQRRYAAVVGATLTWTLLANTWLLPLQGLAIAGWFVVENKQWRRLLPAVVAGAAAIWLLAYPYLNQFTVAAAGYQTALRMVPMKLHTPPLMFLIFMLPTLCLIGLGLCARSRMGFRLALLWAALLGFSEFCYIDDIYSGAYERFNTTLKWWPWIAAGTLMTLAPYLLDHARFRWVRWLGVVVLIYPCCYVYDLWTPLLTAPEISRGKLEGTNYLTKDEFPRLILGRLKVEPLGIAVERPEAAGSFTNSAVIPLFAGQRMWLGWYNHEQLWRAYGEDIRRRHEALLALYNGTMANAGQWLRAQGIDYVLWFRPGDTPDLWAKIDAQVEPDYLWVDILTYEGPGDPKASPRVGFWRRRRPPAAAEQP